MDINKPRPPYVTFETKAVHDREQTIAQGKACYKDVNYANITPMGSRDIIPLQVEEWFETLRHEVAEQRFDPEWLRAYENAYESWKKGLEAPLNGTSIKNWPAVSPAMVKTLLEAKLYTVEDVAVMNEQAINFVGMGARALKQKAIDWLTASESSGKASEELSALRAENDNLRTTIEALQAEFKAMKAAQTEKSSK